MNQVGWKFRIPQESEVNQDPIEGEFFTTQDVGDFADGLVRESIQNSLDAGLKDKGGAEKVVTVRFFFSGKTNANNVGINNHHFFQGINDHIFSPDNGLNKKDIPSLSEKTQFLVIEDFQTSGLDGSTIENDDPKTDSPLGHNFYWFWRNVGRSGKKGSERGKWGLGKTVFPASSSINTFFGLTSRWDDKKSLLMGLSVLKTHHIASEPQIKRYPYGYFGIFENEDKYFATPTGDESIMDEFRKCFKLKRTGNTNPGLSVVIPFIRMEITSLSIIRSILRQYFYPIIKGNLIVEVVDDDSKIDIQIDAKSIFKLLDEIDFPAEYGISRLQLTKLFNLCKWAIEDGEKEAIKLNPPSLSNAVMWRRDWYVTEKVEKALQSKIDAFDEGERIAFSIPVKTHEVDGNAQTSWFKVFLEKDEIIQEADSHFVRDGITITGIRKPKYKFVRAVVIIEDDGLVKLLGLAENPAHTEWQKNSSHFIGKYIEGDKVISFIEKSIDNVCSLLIKPTEGIDRELLKDVFFVEIQEDSDQPDDPDDDAGEESEKPKPLPFPRKIFPYIIEKGPGGFRIKKNPETNGFSGYIKVEIAYAVVKGSPIRRYSQYDFDLSKKPIAIIPTEISALQNKLNKLSFEVSQDNDFSVEVRGFDEERDLYIKANHYDS